MVPLTRLQVVQMLTLQLVTNGSLLLVMIDLFVKTLTVLLVLNLDLLFSLNKLLREKHGVLASLDL